MNDQTNRAIAEGNKLIAKFTGAEVSDGYARWVTEIPNGSISRNIPIEQLKYHSDWNELMPVVEKIEGMGYSVTIVSNYCQILHGYSSGPGPNDIAIESPTKLQATYSAIIEFLKFKEDGK